MVFHIVHPELLIRDHIIQVNDFAEMLSEGCARFCSLYLTITGCALQVLIITIIISLATLASVSGSFLPVSIALMQM